MNKLPAKQIYLLSVIIVGIIALSVYSTYALFTFENSTSDIVSIHTPKSLQISENIYEYQQLTIEPNKVITTDIDIYNTFEYDVCYSIWYKIVGESDETKIQLFQKSDKQLTSSGVLNALNNIRVTIAIINDNEEEIKVNIGTIGEQLEEGSCSLNISEDKNVISSTYSNLENLNEMILKNVDKIENVEAGYRTYPNQKQIMKYKDTDKIYISDKFLYDKELFTLEEPLNLTFKEIEEKYNELKDIYFCKEKDKCEILYKITELKKQEIEKEPPEENEIYYEITTYDKMIGYYDGPNGLRKINEKDYIFYGDNPNNYIYYNCENSDDPETCELWRIIGLYYNKNTDKYNMKIIKNDSIGKYSYDDTENEELLWANSTLHKYLNEEYKLKNNYDIYLEEIEETQETLISIEDKINEQEEKTISKVNILNLSDYVYTTGCNIKELKELSKECIKNNWLDDIEINQVWTKTQKEIIEEEPTENDSVEEEITIDEIEQTENKDETIEQEEMVETEKNEIIETEENEVIEPLPIINYNYSIGRNILEIKTSELLDVRPTLYLKSRMLVVEGDGSFEKPYVIK